MCLKIRGPKIWWCHKKNKSTLLGDFGFLGVPNCVTLVAYVYITYYKRYMYTHAPILLLSQVAKNFIFTWLMWAKGRAQWGKLPWYYRRIPPNARWPVASGSPECQSSKGGGASHHDDKWQEFSPQQNVYVVPESRDGLGMLRSHGKNQSQAVYIDWSTDTTLLEPYNPPLTWAFGTEKGWESFVDPCSLSVYMECGRSFPFPKFVNHPIKKGELDVPLTNKWRCWSCLRSGHLSCLESTFFQVQLTETSFAPLQYI